MPGSSRRHLVLLLVIAIIALSPVSSAAVGADKPKTNKAADAILLRPLAFIGFVVGTAFFVPGAYVTMLTRPQDISLPFELMVAGPARYVFVDPLGSH